jgi:hypothetical protein
MLFLLVTREGRERSASSWLTVSLVNFISRLGIWFGGGRCLTSSIKLAKNLAFLHSSMRPILRKPSR